MMKQKEEDNALTRESNDKMWSQGTLTGRCDRRVQTQLYLERLTTVNPRKHPRSMAQVQIIQNSLNTRNLQEKTMQYTDMMARQSLEGKHGAADIHEDEAVHKQKREMNPNK